MKRLVLFLSLILSFQLIANTAFAEIYALQVVDSGDFENGNTGLTDDAFSKTDTLPGYKSDGAICGTLSDGSPNHCLEVGVYSDTGSTKPYYQINFTHDEGTLEIKGRIKFSKSHAMEQAMLLGYWKVGGTRATSAKVNMFYVDDGNAMLGASDDNSSQIPMGEFVNFKYVFEVIDNGDGTKNGVITPYYNNVEGNKFELSDFWKFVYVRIHPYTAQAPGYIQLDDIEIIKSVKQSEITDINGGNHNNVPCDSTGLLFEVTDPLPASVYEHPEHIKVLGGGADLEAKSIAGDGNSISVVLSGKLESDTEYTLRISKEAYMNSPKDTAVDVEMNFKTAMKPFDIGVPSCGSDGSGQYSLSVEINNEELTAKTVALIAVTYQTDANGKNRIVDIDTCADVIIPPGSQRFPLSVGGLTLAENKFVKLYSIDGWAGKRPLFGKVSTKTYDDFVNPGA